MENTIFVDKKWEFGEVYGWYDGPILCSAINKENPSEKLLVSAIDTGHTDLKIGYAEWLLTPTNDDILEKMVKNEITLYEATVPLGTDTLTIKRCWYTENREETIDITVEELVKMDMLPDKGIYLEYESEEDEHSA